jgi:hypothetical protein
MTSSFRDIVGYGHGQSAFWLSTIIGSIILSATGFYFAKLTTIWTRRKPQALILRSPLATYSRSNSEDSSKLITKDNPYPLDSFPGGKNVESPYGTMRVYEWGPETGRRVLLIAGVTTPAVAFAKLAPRLVSDGCRVMM